MTVAPSKLRRRINELGPVLTVFAGYHALVIIAVLVPLVVAVIRVLVASFAPRVGDGVISIAVEVPLETLMSWALAIAFAIGLGFLLTGHRVTRSCWIVVLTLSVAVRALFLIRGVSVPWSLVAMVISLGWLVCWLSSRRVRSKFA